MLNLEFFGHTPVVSASEAVTIRDTITKQNKLFVDVVFDQQHFEELYRILNPLIGSFESVVLIGIGGSSLGAKMLTRALFNDTYPKVYFLDNISPYLLQNTLDSLNLSKTVFLIQSKSGSTPEVIATFLKIEDILKENSLLPHEHCIIVSEAEQGFLHKYSTQYNYPFLAMPTGLGGRYSVLSASGLVLATLLGIDTKSILEGAQEFYKDSFLEVNRFEAYLLAKYIYDQYTTGHKVLALWNYSDRLKEFGNWASQLIAESLGKTAEVGITPLSVTGVTDQHSMLQLFRDGPDDKTYLMIKLMDHEVSINMPANVPTEFGYLAGKSFQEIFDAEYQGTLTSLRRAERPIIQLTLERIDASHVGQLIAILELTTAILGAHFGINTWDQPGVEESKVLTKDLLSNS
jgi:glucose-6-phosphate isomerase